MLTMQSQSEQARNKQISPEEGNAALHDTVIDNLVSAEQVRQQQTMSFIASENHTSQQIMNITGSVLTNKYAEGYPGKRYYAGCAVVDAVEQCAIDRCKELFGAEHVNIQANA